jgi:rod shape determining protein RodA
VPGIDRRVIQNFEWPALALGVGIALVGIANLVSAAHDQGGLIPGTAQRQLAYLGAGLIALLIALIPDYRSLERVTPALYTGCVIALIAVLFFAPIINGSQRWLTFGPASIQPSEMMKLVIVLVFARILHRRPPNSEMGLLDLIGPGVLVAAPVALVLRQPDLGTAMIIAIIAGTYVLLGRVRVQLLLWLTAIGIVGATAAWTFYLHDYQKERVFTFLDPERDPLGTAYHAIQSQIAVGSGGLFGKGFTKGSQSQLDFLPEQQTDFVFSVLGEEWGFVGATVVLMLYLMLLVRGLMIARASKDLYGAYIALGIVSLFFWSGAINVGMVVGVLPVVGVPLPFFSRGGSSLVTCLASIGLLMNVSMRRYVF